MQPCIDTRTPAPVSEWPHCGRRRKAQLGVDGRRGGGQTPHGALPSSPPHPSGRVVTLVCAPWGWFAGDTPMGTAAEQSVTNRGGGTPHGP